MLNKIKASMLILLLTVSTLAGAQTDDFAIFSNLDGEPRRLEDYTGGGQWLVVMIWASDCHICNAEATSYARFHESQRENGVTVLGISMDGEEKKAAALAFVERHKLPFTNLIGEAGMTGLYYAALTKEPLRGTPSFLIFDPEGELAAAQAGAVSTEAITRFIATKDPARTANR